MPFLPRDFIETREGLLFAVVAPGTEEGRVRGFLRYVNDGNTWSKLNTESANNTLAQRYPDYLYHSPMLDAPLHGVPLENIRGHHRPVHKVRDLCAATQHDDLETKALLLIEQLTRAGIPHEHLGITGSLLIGAHGANSDIDLTCYARESFARAQLAIESALAVGELQTLSLSEWEDAYKRRGCALDFPTFLWHEQRKLNKAVIAGTKFDIALVQSDGTAHEAPCRKLGFATIRATVIDDFHAYDHPARYRLDHREVLEAVSCTHTYVGQARRGEQIEVSGHIEECGEGTQRIVVGSNREAHGEYIRVLGT